MAVAGLTLPGLVYVGRTLPPAKGGEQNNNCLVDPGLAVPRTTSDTAGRHLEYCPSYGSMKPSSRRAYLEWLAGDRAAPGTPIGYVFLYLYGLERRGVLEGSAEDRPAIRAEVERLLSVYGDNGSFRHYASCLLAALDALSLVPGTDPAPVFEPSGYELPLSVRFAVGSRIRDGKPVEGVWLLAWTMSHPETRVRTPARRAFDRVRDEFVAEFERRHPSGGLPIKWRKGAPSPALYRAASRTFEVDLALFGSERMPDLARHADALALGRELLDLSSDRLDAYSRHLGKEAGRASPSRSRPWPCCRPASASARRTRRPPPTSRGCASGRRRAPRCRWPSWAGAWPGGPMREPPPPSRGSWPTSCAASGSA
ncbi:TerB N-terminal domain-containing protein [Methylobacterium sp. DCY52]|uniref:TerB N-terminal domain-containing protein n=1 Tax=Methylobacterium sp. DCY52 TaxID=739139 RepID=UPI0031455F19